MGGGGKSSSAPVEAPPAPPIPAAPPAPKMDELANSEEALKAKKMREMERLKRGRSSTLLTSGEGDVGQLTVRSEGLQATTVKPDKKKLGE